MAPVLSGNPDYRRPWILALIVFTTVLLADIILLAPWVSWIHDSQDSGDLICSAYFLGIPHPTGYPTYCILAKLFQLVIPFGSIAWRTNLLSAVSAALCCALISLLVHRVLNAGLNDNAERKLTRALILPLLAGFGLGFSRTFLSQSVISEVYTLNALFVALNLYLVIEALCITGQGNARRHRRLLTGLAFCYGLGLTNHLSTVFLFPIIVYAFWVLRRSLNIKALAFC